MVLVTSLTEDLQPIIPLFLNVALREQALARFDEKERLAAEEIFQCGSRLSEMTDWTQERLLVMLGCKIKTLEEFHKAELDGLERCEAFLRLVTRNAGLVDTVPDRREMVVESARLLKAIGGSTGRLEELLTKKDRKYSAIHYIRLGEIEEASEQVRRFAGVTAVDQADDSVDPFSGVPTVHLSATRIDMLIRGAREELGEEVANYMAAHIENCRSCHDAFERRQGALHL